jgi:hypothetical protein
MTKEELFKDIEEIKSDKLFITDSVDNIDEEVRSNCWSISIPDEVSVECIVDELKNFLKEVKADRREQLRKANSKVGLIYYVWIDEQAGQLRFNFINSNHNKLPFSASLAFVAKEGEILSEYLSRTKSHTNIVRVYKELIVV